jgi:hypothetical protein
LTFQQVQNFYLYQNENDGYGGSPHNLPENNPPKKRLVNFPK